MEIKVYKDTVTAAQSICDTKLELPIEAEMLIPDYLPQVFKIVKCFVHLVVLQKQVMAGRLTVDGYLRCVLYYQSEGDESLCQAEQKLPFTNFPAPLCDAVMQENAIQHFPNIGWSPA